MNIILHGEGKDIRMHQCSAAVLQHTLTVPVKVFSGVNWFGPIVTDKEVIYKFVYQAGDYYHYRLDPQRR